MDKSINKKIEKKFKAVFQFEGTQKIKYYKDQYSNWYVVQDNEINFCCNWKNGTPPSEKLEFDKEVFDVELIENIKTREQKNNG